MSAVSNYTTRVLLILSVFLYPVHMQAQDICTEKQIETSILIRVSADRVWNKLSDFEQYDQWHPYISKVRGPLKKGRFIKVYYFDSTGATGSFSVRLLSVKPGKELSWGGSLGFIFRAKHYFILQLADDLSTRLIQGEYWRGIFGRPYGRKIYFTTFHKFIEMNQKLKTVLEEAYQH